MRFTAETRVCLNFKFHPGLHEWVAVRQGRIRDFFLGGGVLVSCSTSTTIYHIFLGGEGGGQNTSCIRKPRVISGGEGCAPPAPSP